MARYYGDSASAYCELQEEERYNEEMELRRKELSLKEMELKQQSASIDRLTRKIDELTDIVIRLERKLDGYETKYFNPFISHIESDK